MPIDKIRRGDTFTGRKLRDAIRLAARPPLGVVKNMLVTSTAAGQQSTVRQVGRSIIPVRTFPTIIAGHTPIAPGQWDYSATEVWVDNATGFYVVKPGGRQVTARNRAEHGNDGAAEESYGVNVDDTGAATVTLLPIRIGAVVDMKPERDNTGAIAHRFSAGNDVEVECTG